MDQYSATSDIPASGRVYVYIVRAYSNYYKLGMTRNPRQRMSSLRSYLPEEPLSMEFFSVDDEEVEREILEMFPTRRLRGEWFELSPEEVEKIREKILEEGGEFAEN